MDKRPHSLQLQIVSGGGIDENGNPIKLLTDWSVPFPCKYKRSLQAKIIASADGKMRYYSYTITIDRDELEGFDLKEEQLVRLYDDDEQFEVENTIKGFSKGTKTVKICL